MNITDFDPYLDFDLTVLPPPSKPEGPIPVWEIATMFPLQGDWTEEQYLELTDSTNRKIEFVAGHLEFLAMPTEVHQLLLLYLMDVLRAAIEPNRGMVLFSGIRVRTVSDAMREPDLVYLCKENYAKRGDRFWKGADLALEVVSPDANSENRDYVTKRSEYAAAGIAEYWIVDPQESKITVLTLPEGKSEYAEHGVFRPGETATSKLLDGFVVDVKACFDAAKA